MPPVGISMDWNIESRDMGGLCWERTCRSQQVINCDKDDNAQSHEGQHEGQQVGEQKNEQSENVGYAHIQGQVSNLSHRCLDISEKSTTNLTNPPATNLTNLQQQLGPRRSISLQSHIGNVED